MSVCSLNYYVVDNSVENVDNMKKTLEPGEPGQGHSGEI